MSLRLRLTLVYTAFLALVLVVVAGGVYAFTERSLLAQLERRADELTEAVGTASHLPSALQSLPSDAHFEIMVYTRPVRRADDLANGRWEDGSIYGRGNPDARGRLWSSLSNADYQQLFEQGALITLFRDASGEETITKIERFRYVLAGELDLEAAFLVGLPRASIEPILRQLRVNLATMVIAAFGLFALGVWLLSGQALLPVKRVTAAAARIGSQDLAQRVPVSRAKDEMSELALAINHMLGRLQESFETQRRFTADASHELRTPVTAIVGHANYLLRRTTPSADQLESLNVIRGEGERMAKLVNDLLELARADAGFAVKREPMNLVEVVEAVHKEVRRTAEGAEITLSLPSPIVEVDGDASRLKQVVLNLVQNALNAGSKHVSVTLTQTKDEATLEVLDDGPGIPEGAIPFLFERFYRVDSARSTRGNGSGLGLAIVKWIVVQHGGEVKVDSKLGEGTAFSVVLPAYQEQDHERSTARVPALKPVRT